MRRGLSHHYYYWDDYHRAGGLAFWGGYFYIFLRPDDARSTRIYRFNPADASLEEIMRESGLDIVDAGVSTCAPVTII